MSKQFGNFLKVMKLVS